MEITESIRSWEAAQAQQPDHGNRVLPVPAQALLAADPLAGGLYPARLGCFPAARGHGTRRSAAEAEEWLLMVCYEGRGRVTLDGETVTLAAGEAVLLPPGRPHDYRASSTAPWSLYWVHFLGSEAAAMAASLRALAGHDWYWGGVDLRAVRREFMPFLRAGQAARSELELLRLAARLRLVLLQMAPREQGGASTDWDQAAVEALMEAQVEGMLELEDLARAAGLSRYQICRRYKAATGQTPMQAYTEHKMRRACELLEDPALRVGQVAARLGYDDPHYFSRVFRKTIGYSPSDYQRLAQG